MTSDKAQRDAANNERFQDRYVHASQKPWIQFYPGVGFKLLRATQETGHWTVLLNCAKGSSIPPHEHLGAGEYYVISGKMEIRGGIENGGITSITGDYGYEPNGVKDGNNGSSTGGSQVRTRLAAGGNRIRTISTAR